MKNTKRFNSVVRAEVFILLGVVTLLLILYVYFFLNFHVKRVIEKSAFQSIGAEVNIESVKIDFFKPSVSIVGIEVTNPDKPLQNIVEIKKILSIFSYLPLLQGSFISDLTSVSGIEFHTKRDRPGRVLPKEQRILVLQDPSQNKVQEVLKDKFRKTAFSDLVNLFSDKNRGEIEEKYKKSLESLKLSAEVEKKINEFKSKLDNLESYAESKEIKDLLSEVKTFRFDSSSTEASIKSTLKAVSLAKKLKKKKKKIKLEVSALRKEGDAIKAELKSAPSKFLADIGGVQNSLSLANISSEKITEDVLSEYFSVQLEQVTRATTALKNDALGSGGQYVDLESKGAAAQNEFKGDEISQTNLERRKEESYFKKGRNFVFHKASVSPKYWFKKIEIISEAHSGQDFGDVSGYISNFTDAPQITDKEMVIDIDGSVPKQNIGSFKIDAVIDHRNTEYHKEKISINVSEYLVQGLELFKGPNEWIKILKSNSQTILNVTLQGEDVSIELLQKMRSPVYETFAEDKNILNFLNELKLSKEDLSFKLSARGKISSPKVRVSSNLGKILLRAVKKNASKMAGDFAASQLSKLDGKAAEKLKPYLKDIDITSLKAADINKLIDEEIEKSLSKLKSSGKSKKGLSKKDELLNKLFKKF